MFDNLSERLERSFKILKGEGKITEINVAETLKDVRKALLDADVNYKVAKSFTDRVKEKAIGQNVLTAVKPSQLMVKIVHDELVELMGGTAADFNAKGQPAVVLMSGLQGSGKTTFSAKLANLLKSKKSRKPMLAACDVYRPAAIDQLKVLGEQIGVPVYSEPDSKDPVEIAQNAVKEARANGYDVLIIDTAGRLAVDEQMMNEISAIKDAVNPTETLFVVDSMGSAVTEAQHKVSKLVKLPSSYYLKWAGDFENQQRATNRLEQVVPISIIIIFIILFVLFSNVRDAVLVLCNVPFAAVGGIMALLITRFNFSISAGIGFIALFGICIQNGVIMIGDIKQNLRQHLPLDESVRNGVNSRIRSVVMTAAMAMIGLFPAATSHGIGSESQRPLAIVIIGGLVTATFFVLFVFPLIIEKVYRMMLYDKKGKLYQRKL